MKKFFYAVPMAIMAYMLSVVGYAEGDVTIGRVEIVDYVMYIGLGIFLIGMVMVLLSVFVSGKKAAEDEAYEDYEDYEDYEEYEETETAEEEIVEEAVEEVYEDEIPEEVIEEPEEEIIEEPIAEEPIEEPIEEAIEVPVEEPIEEESIEEVEPEEKVRLTLSGINNGDFKIVEFTKSLTIGRKNFNDIVVEDKAVSGSHCEITYENGAVYIADLGSTNGTYVNDELVVRCEIKSGDAIVIGKSKYKINISM